MPPVPNLYDPLKIEQVDNLLGRINMDNTAISMASNDLNLIRKLKATIEYQ